MTYGLLASGSCLLTDIADQLHEPSKKVNTVERLSKHFLKNPPASISHRYLTFIRSMVPSVAKLYFSRCQIDEYFRAKMQMFRFEDIRVRKLIAINS